MLNRSSLSQGLTSYRKIPWRMSSPQKLRHRRRLRRVDNVVAVLDNALKRQTASAAHQSTEASSPARHNNIDEGPASSEELSTSVEGQVMLDSAANANQEARRHGRGPRQGEMVPEFTSRGVEVPGRRRLADKAQAEGTIKLIERWKVEMPTEQEMLPRDKYTIFDRKAKKYRKGKTWLYDLA